MKIGSRKILVLDDEFARDVPDDGRHSQTAFINHLGGRRNVDFHFCTALDDSIGSATPEVAMSFLRSHNPNESLLLLDIVFGKVEDFGLRLLPRIRREFPDLPVVMMTGNRPTDSGRELLMGGALDWIIKPLDRRRFWRTVRRYQGTAPTDWLLGHNDFFLSAISTVASHSEVCRSMLIQGADADTRKAFTTYACRSAERVNLEMLDVMTESTADIGTRLFGIKPSRWGAAPDPIGDGLLNLAKGGVLHLAHIQALPYGLQAQLAEFLIRQQSLPLDQQVLVVADCDGGLAAAAMEDRFSRELFDALNGDQPVTVPPDVWRQEDMLLLLSVAGRTVVNTGAAFDAEDETFLSGRIRLLSCLELSGWWAECLTSARKSSGLRLSDNLPPLRKSRIQVEEALPKFDSEDFENGGCDRIQIKLYLAELGLVLSAYSLANGSRAGAAALLKPAQGRISTNDFDRRFLHVWKKLPSHVQRSLLEVSKELRQVLKTLNKVGA